MEQLITDLKLMWGLESTESLICLAVIVAVALFGLFLIKKL